MRRIGIALIIIGVLGIMVSSTADIIGLSDDPGFQIGPRQSSGIFASIFVALIGAYLFARSGRND